MFKIKPKITKIFLEITSIIATVLIFMFLIQSLHNFIRSSYNFSSIKDSVNLQINTLNSIYTTLPHLGEHNKIIYLNTQLDDLYKIQKNEGDELVNIISLTNVEETQNKEYIVNIMMQPSSHTCFFLERQKELKGKIELQGFNNSKYDCRKDVISVKYFLNAK